ncbi:MAG: sigma-70 factor domain-containing protein, partial [Planctomycetota bacterium]
MTLFDGLLDFDDDLPRSADDLDGLHKLSLEEEGDDLTDAVVDVVIPEDQVQLDSEDDLLSGMDDVETWSDDPVRMYLTQMGEIPLLTRQEEIRLAKKIEVTRRRFRTKLLECDYVIQYAYKILRRVHTGELPFDRTVQVSVTDRLEKDQILGRLPSNLKTLDVLLKRNRRDYRDALSRSLPPKKRAEA